MSDKFDAFRNYDPEKEVTGPISADMNEEEQNWFECQMPNDPFSKKNVTLVEVASEAILAEYKFLTVEENQSMWYWEKGVYVPGAETLIAKHAEKLYGYKLANRHLAEIKGHIMRRTYHKLKEIDANIHIINLKNGLYDIA